MTALFRPCPFCRVLAPGSVPATATTAVIELDKGLWVVICRTCNAFGPHPEPEQDPANAIRRWNDRSEARGDRIGVPGRKVDLDFLLMATASVASLALIGLAIYLS